MDQFLKELRDSGLSLTQLFEDEIQRNNIEKPVLDFCKIVNDVHPMLTSSILRVLNAAFREQELRDGPLCEEIEIIKSVLGAYLSWLNNPRVFSYSVAGSDGKIDLTSLTLWGEKYSLPAKDAEGWPAWLRNEPQSNQRLLQKWVHIFIAHLWAWAILKYTFRDVECRIRGIEKNKFHYGGFPQEQVWAPDSTSPSSSCLRLPREVEGHPWTNAAIPKSVWDLIASKDYGNFTCQKIHQARQDLSKQYSGQLHKFHLFNQSKVDFWLTAAPSMLNTCSNTCPEHGKSNGDSVEDAADVFDNHTSMSISDTSADSHNDEAKRALNKRLSKPYNQKGEELLANEHGDTTGAATSSFLPMDKKESPNLKIAQTEYIRNDDKFEAISKQLEQTKKELEQHMEEGRRRVDELEQSLGHFQQLTNQQMEVSNQQQEALTVKVAEHDRRLKMIESRLDDLSLGSLEYGKAPLGR